MPSRQRLAPRTQPREGSTREGPSPAHHLPTAAQNKANISMWTKDNSLGSALTSTGGWAWGQNCRKEGHPKGQRLQEAQRPVHVNSTPSAWTPGRSSEETTVSSPRVVTYQWHATGGNAHGSQCSTTNRAQTLSATTPRHTRHLPVKFNSLMADDSRGTMGNTAQAFLKQTLDSKSLTSANWKHYCKSAEIQANFRHPSATTTFMNLAAKGYSGNWIQSNILTGF